MLVLHPDTEALSAAVNEAAAKVAASLSLDQSHAVNGIPHHTTTNSSANDSSNSSSSGAEPSASRPTHFPTTGIAGVPSSGLIAKEGAVTAGGKTGGKPPASEASVVVAAGGAGGGEVGSDGQAEAREGEREGGGGGAAGTGAETGTAGQTVNDRGGGEGAERREGDIAGGIVEGGVERIDGGDGATEGEREGEMIMVEGEAEEGMVEVSEAELRELQMQAQLEEAATAAARAEKVALDVSVWHTLCALHGGLV